MGIFRSEDMDLYEIHIPKDAAWEVMNRLGDIGIMHFINLNKDEQVFNLTYAPFIKRCEETDKRITLIEQECKRHHVSIVKPKSVQEFLWSINNLQESNKSGELFFESIEQDICEKEQFVKDQTKKSKEIHNSLTLLIEYKTVLQKTQQILQFNAREMIAADGSLNDRHRADAPLMQDGPGIAVGHIAGTICKEEEYRFKKLIFRATRGNALTYFEDFDNPIKDYDGKEIQKSVYVVIFQEGDTIKEKIVKICDSFLGEIFDIPTGGIQEKIDEINHKINDTQNVIGASNEEIRNYLIEINKMNNTVSSTIQLYKWFIVKEKALYNNLNKLKMGSNLLVGLFWCATSQKQQVSDKVSQISQNRNISSPQIAIREEHGLVPPTYVKTNEFTFIFQKIVDTYGVPDYKEVNPAMFTIVTFPFLFGVMYGDMFHGFLLLLFGAFLTLFDSKLKDTALESLSIARYILLMMGFFAFFCGVCYNDFASIPLWGGTCFAERTDNQQSHSGLTETETTIWDHKEDCVYPVGIDPIWYISENDLTFINTMKMKMAVIFGVTHMSLGITMKAFNAFHFRKYLDFFFEFIPQITLLWSLFGWMNILIIIKWLTPWYIIRYEKGEVIPDKNVEKAPGIISVMISMFLKFGETDTEVNVALAGSADTQQAIMITFLVIALICIPMMLCVKPFVLRCQMKSHHNHQQSFQGRGSQRFQRLDEEEDDVSDNGINQHETNRPASNLKNDEIDIEKIILKETKDDEGHDFGEIFIHQLIETIEFVLGTVSNTASYLRLWALSLAHSQLALVFFEQLLKKFGLAQEEIFNQTVGLFFLFPGWATMTLFVLLLMDAMECFLHTLRLHWVEFQNKFYKGNGYLFTPFNYHPALEEEKKRKI
ncbi:unnamed protein product [Moneuplotes crassus]|uniref:V-type proton ATPase subunit a n=1 Tax=Euplotes crassus TaxID=5936 RepID=A0AAD2D920_EUPCR|nr:unnamed protein product [Moneuplotes crassus]